MARFHRGSDVDTSFPSFIAHFLTIVSQQDDILSSRPSILMLPFIRIARCLWWYTYFFSFSPHAGVYRPRKSQNDFLPLSPAPLWIFTPAYVCLICLSGIILLHSKPRRQGVIEAAFVLSKIFIIVYTFDGMKYARLSSSFLPDRLCWGCLAS